MMDSVEVFETFVSIQGESTFAGLPCFFIRLAGCNLRCRYCDTLQAYGAGTPTSIAALVEACGQARAACVEITGGEPLIQPGTPALASALLAARHGPVLIETNGSRDLSVIPAGAIAIMDVKCPGSGESASMDWGNLDRLRPCDEVKFVICDRTDYEWARELVTRHRLCERCHAVLFSPASGWLAPSELAGWMLRDRLPVRLQVQLHKLIGAR